MKFEARFSLDNAAFSYGLYHQFNVEPTLVAEQLRRIANAVEEMGAVALDHMNDGGRPVIDRNGNTIGRWQFLNEETDQEGTTS